VSAFDGLAALFGDRRPDPVPELPQVPELTPLEAALVAEACSKSGVVWVRPYTGEAADGTGAAGRHVLAWQVWHDDAVTLVQGGGEQELPAPAEAMEVVIPSKDARGRIATVLARAQVLEPGSAQWSAAADALSAARLNDRDPRHQRERWAAGALIVQLVPLRMLTVGAGGDGSPSGAAPPPRSEATTVGRRPWHVGGRGAPGRSGGRRR
jgi:hypothetical protein